MSPTDRSSNDEQPPGGPGGLAPGRGVGVAPPQDTETTWSALSADTRRQRRAERAGFEPAWTEVRPGRDPEPDRPLRGPLLGLSFSCTARLACYYYRRAA